MPFCINKMVKCTDFDEMFAVKFVHALIWNVYIFTHLCNSINKYKPPVLNYAKY